MRVALNKARERYQKNYEMFILRIERDADEVIVFIKSLRSFTYFNNLDHASV